MGSIRRRPRMPAAPRAASASAAPARAAPARAAPARAAPAISEENSFESLRLAFHARLESERVHFVTLSAALARAEESPVWIFEDLVYRAHRLQGGAAIFEESAVALAAGKLESAAGMAARSRAGNTDEEVWAALEALVNLMGTVEPVRGVAHA